MSFMLSDPSIAVDGYDLIRTTGDSIGAIVAIIHGMATNSESLTNAGVEGLRAHRMDYVYILAGIVNPLPGSSGRAIREATEALPSLGKQAAKGGSKIDRGAFKREREAYWKKEAQSNPGKYSRDDLDRMRNGRAPTGPDGKPVELHHRDGTPGGPLDPMSRTEHRGGDNYQKNHPWLGD